MHSRLRVVEMRLIRSLQDKMMRAHHLALGLDPSVVPADAADDVAAWQDGLYHKYVLDRLSGRCALADRLAFDLEAFETMVDDRLRRLELLVKDHGRRLPCG